jgi:hypothetical protein
MNMPGLEDHLHDLADRVAAPATDAARQTIGHRAGVLRRRRQVRNAAGAGVLALALAVVAGGLVLRDDPADVEMRPAEPGADDTPGADDAVPALTVDGWEVVPADEGPPDPAGGEGAATVGSFQVFRGTGGLLGPTVFLRHTPVSDTDGPLTEDERVDVGGTTAYLSSLGPDDNFLLRWQPMGDSAVTLHSWNLSRDDVLAFANGLQPRDEDGTIQYPGSDDQFGFDAPVSTTEMEELPVLATTVDPSSVRVVELTREEASVELEIGRGNERDFDAGLDDLLTTVGEATEVSVMERPGVLVHHPDSGTWTLTWRPTDDTVASMTASDVDESTVNEIVASIRAMSPEE